MSGNGIAPFKYGRQKLFDALMKGLDSVLLPGSSERIRREVSIQGVLPPESMLASRVFDHIHSENGSLSLRPEVADRSGTGKSFAVKWKDGKTDLQRVVDAFPFRPAATKEIADSLGFELNGKSPGMKAWGVVKAMGDRSFREKNLISEASRVIPVNEMRVRDFIQSKFGDLFASSSELATYARRCGEAGMGNVGLRDLSVELQIAKQLHADGKLTREDPRCEIVPEQTVEPRRSLVS